MERHLSSRPLGGALAISIAPSPGGIRARTGVSRAPLALGRRTQGTARSRTRCGLSAESFSLGAFYLTTRQSRGGGGEGAIRDPTRVSKLWEEPSPCFPAWARSECPFGAGPELRRAGPRPGSRGSASQPQLGFQRRPLPALCPSAAQPRPDQPGSISRRSQRLEWLKIGGHLTTH